MAHRILSITFEIDAQSHRDGHFSIPQDVTAALGVSSGSLYLDIWTPHGSWSGVREMKSGREIYGSDLCELIKAAQRIRVTASRPQ